MIKCLKDIPGISSKIGVDCKSFEGEGIGIFAWKQSMWNFVAIYGIIYNLKLVCSVSNLCCSHWWFLVRIDLYTSNRQCDVLCKTFCDVANDPVSSVTSGYDTTEVRVCTVRSYDPENKVLFGPNISRSDLNKIEPW